MKKSLFVLMLTLASMSAYSDDRIEPQLDAYDASSEEALSEYRDEHGTLDSRAIIGDLLPVSPATMLNIIKRLGGR